jgi:hypothetical protein
MIEINTTDDLKALLRQKFPKTRLIININNGMKGFESRLNGYIQECGCQMGSIFLAFSIILVIVFIVVFRIGILKELVIGFTFLLFMALIGKAIGILSARYKFYHTIKTILKFDILASN